MRWRFCVSEAPEPTDEDNCQNTSTPVAEVIPVTAVRRGPAAAAKLFTFRNFCGLDQLLCLCFLLKIRDQLAVLPRKQWKPMFNWNSFAPNLIDQSNYT